MKDIFIDSKLNKKFKRDGFIKIPLFNAMQVRELKEFYYSKASQQRVTNDSFHVTSNSNNQDLIKEVTDFLKPLFTQELKRYLKDCEFAIGNYLVKESGKDSAVKAHTDTTLVDESKDMSFSAWVCLEDADYRTGNMQFVPGSHTFRHSLRVIPDRHQYYEGIQHILPDYLIDVPTKAGECLIFLHSTIHASRTNQSGKPRIACVLGGHNKGAEQLFFFLPHGAPNDKIEKYKASTQTYLDLIKNERPQHATFIDYVKYDFSPMSMEEFHQKAIQYSTRCQRIKSRTLNAFIGSSYYTG